MSLLSSTQGTPERVWSLIAALSANGGRLDRSEAVEWLNPGFTRNGNEVRERPDAFNQTLGAATSLGAVESDRDSLCLDPACATNDFAAFCDWVHNKLVTLESEEKDAVVLETYAWIAAESDRLGSVGWIYEKTNDAFADAADEALPPGASDDDGARRINTTKLSALRRWLTCIGLLVPMPLSTMQAYPAADARVSRALNEPGPPTNVELAADAFLKVLAERLPYLDGGRMFVDAAKRIGYAPAARKLSPLLSSALLNLHDDGAIELRLRGDAGDIVRLSGISHRIQSFHAVVIKSEAAT